MVVLGLLGAATIVTQAMILAELLSSGFSGTAEAGDLKRLLLGLAAIFGFRAVLGLIQELVAEQAATVIIGRLRSDFLAKIITLGPTWSAGERASDLSQVATQGMEALKDYFSRYIPQVVLTLIVPLTVIIVVAQTDTLAGGILLITLPLVPFFLALVGMRTRVVQQGQWVALTALGHHFLDVVQGLTTLRIFGRAQHQISQIAINTEEYRRRTMKVLRISFLSSAVLELVATLSVAVVAVSVGLRLQADRLELKTALLVLLLAPEVYNPLRQVGALYHASATGLAASATVVRVLTTVLPQRGSRISLPPVAETGLRLDQVSVQYAHRPVSLPPVSFRITPDRLIVLTGPSGCGKSSVLAALLGLAPTNGRVMIGKIPLTELKPEFWYEQVAWLPQRPGLIAGTLAENIRLGTPSATPDQVRTAMEAAALDLHPSRVLAEDGSGVSGGQRQRIGLARAFCRAEVQSAGLLLLDEPTAHLDPELTKIVTQSIRNLTQGRCVLVVSHQQYLIDRADEVIQVG